MESPYRLLYSRAFDADLDNIPAYDAAAVGSRVRLLAYQAEVAARNRRRLAAPVSWCPDATWQLRVGSYRILYRVDGGNVHVLRVIFKGRKTTEEMGR